MRHYICHYIFRDQHMSFKFNSAISNILNGFWINDRFEVTHGSDARYFIPVHKIEYIESN